MTAFLLTFPEQNAKQTGRFLRLIWQERVISLKRHFRIIMCCFALCLSLSMMTGTACAEMTELSCGKVEYLEYQCTLQDGRLLLTGGTRRDECGGDAAWIMCLNTDRTVSWEYISRKDGFTAAEGAAVLQDGTIAVLMEDYPEKRALMFFTPDGKKARKKLDLKKKRGNVYAVTPSFIMTYDAVSNKQGEFSYSTFLYSLKGGEITHYDGLIMRNGYGFLASGDDGYILYGQDTLYNSHAAIQKLDGSLKKTQWETVLDRQLPGSDTAVLDSVLKTNDGGYVCWLKERIPGEEEASPFEWKYLLVKFSADGNLLWVKDREAPAQSTGPMFLYDGKIGILCEDSSRIDASRHIRWIDESGAELGPTEIRLDPADFTVLRNYLEPENAEEKRTTIVDQQQFFDMEDGLWTLATCCAAQDYGEDGFSVIFDSQEIVMFRIPTDIH